MIIDALTCSRLPKSLFIDQQSIMWNIWNRKTRAFTSNHWRNSGFICARLAGYPSNMQLFYWLVSGCFTISGDTTIWKRSCTMRTWGVHTSRRCLTSSEASLSWPIMRIPLFQSSSHPLISGKCSHSDQGALRHLKKNFWKKYLHNEPLSMYDIKLFCTKI